MLIEEMLALLREIFIFDEEKYDKRSDKYAFGRYY